MSSSKQMDESTPTDGVKAGASGKRKWVILGAVVAVVVLVIVFLMLRPSGSANSAQPTTRTQEVAAQMATLQTTVASTGTINPAQRADLSFSSSGTVKSVKVKVGDAVKSGQALASIDLTDLKSAVDAAKSQVTAAKSDYKTAVSGGNSASINAAKSTLKTQQNNLANAKTALADGTLRAPFSGTVAIVSVSVGDQVSGSAPGSTSSPSTSGNNTSTSAAAITVISTDTYQVATSVGSADVGSVAQGQPCTVVPNGTTTQLPGTVDSVGVIATSSDSSGATFPVVIDITGPQQGLYAGVSASVSIVTSSRQALMIPTAAITYGNGQAHVQLKTGSGTTDTVVQTGQSSGGRTEITSGLKQGDTVVMTITFSTAATNGYGGGFATMFGGGGNRQRPSGARSGGNGQQQMPSGFPTDAQFQGQFPGGAPTDMQFPDGGQPTS